MADDQNYQVPPPMEEGDTRTVPPVGEVNSPNPDTTPGEPREAVTEESRDRDELPEGLEYAGEDDGDGVRFNTIPWAGY